MSKAEQNFPEDTSLPHTEEQDWMDNHEEEAKKHLGKWIAVDSSGVIASTDTFTELANMFIGSSNHPLLINIPKAEN